MKDLLTFVFLTLALILICALLYVAITMRHELRAIGTEVERANNPRKSVAGRSGLVPPPPPYLVAPPDAQGN